MLCYRWASHSDPPNILILPCFPFGLRAGLLLSAGNENQLKTSCRNPVHPLQAPSHPQFLLLQNQREHPWGDSPEVHALALQMKAGIWKQ